MESDSSRTGLVRPDLRAELDRSRDDLAARRVEPLGRILTAIHARASRRIEQREGKGPEPN
jgi:hypothetical protein